MKIIKPSVQFYGAVPTEYNAALKFIEMAGRTCYKSEDKITEDSAEGFVKKLIKAGHLAMVEHSNFVIKILFDDWLSPDCPTNFKYLKDYYANGNFYIGGNIAAWFQEGSKIDWDSKYIYPFAELYGHLFDITVITKDIYNKWQPCTHNEIPKELHRYSAKFICDRGVSHELYDTGLALLLRNQPGT